MPLLECVDINPETSPRAAVIWLHGLGADGHDFEPIVGELGLPEDMAVRFVFPHAPVRPVTLNGGMHMRAWYDIFGLDMRSREDERGIRESEREVARLIEREVAAGVPSDRVLLAGFSQGGAVSLQTGLRYPQPLAGVLALSCYLPLAETLAREAASANTATPIFMAHGLHDSLVPLDLAKQSSEALRGRGYEVEWKTYPMDHSVCMEEVKDISKWFQRTLN